MTEQTTMPDWVLTEAAKRADKGEWDISDLRTFYTIDRVFRALCDLILETQQPPADRKVLCAREAQRAWYDDEVEDTYAACIHAIELWEQGFGQ